MKQQDEHLSLFLDDYSDANADAALDEVLADVNLQYRLRRYQMIGEVMRNELPSAIDTGFHQAVMAGIRQPGEASDRGGSRARRPTPSASPAAERAWFKPFAGLAVAASVALVTIALLQPSQPPGERPADSVASADEQKIQQLAERQIAGSAVPVSSRVQKGTRWKLQNESPAMQQKLNAYLVNHTEYSGSMQGLIPQARVAGYDAQQ